MSADVFTSDGEDITAPIMLLLFQEEEEEKEPPRREEPSSVFNSCSFTPAAFRRQQHHLSSSGTPDLDPTTMSNMLSYIALAQVHDGQVGAFSEETVGQWVFRK